MVLHLHCHHHLYSSLCCSLHCHLYSIHQYEESTTTSISGTKLGLHQEKEKKRPNLEIWVQDPDGEKRKTGDREEWTKEAKIYTQERVEDTEWTTAKQRDELDEIAPEWAQEQDKDQLPIPPWRYMMSVGAQQGGKPAGMDKVPAEVLKALPSEVQWKAAHHLSAYMGRCEVPEKEEKATSKRKPIIELNEPWHESYKRQMEVYQWLVRRNGYDVSDTGYFVYCNGSTDKEIFDGRLEFEVTVIPYTGNDTWIEATIHEIHNCLNSPAIPNADPECDYCTYREAATEVERNHQ